MSQLPPSNTTVTPTRPSKHASPTRITTDGTARARSLLDGTASPNAAFPIVKCGALLATFLTGVPGGIFTPTLSIGAGIGGALHLWIPQLPLSTAVALSMAGYLAAVTQSPLTAFVIVAEMTGTHSAIVLLMISSLIASNVSGALSKPLYQTLARRYL